MSERVNVGAELILHGLSRLLLSIPDVPIQLLVFALVNPAFFIGFICLRLRRPRSACGFGRFALMLGLLAGFSHSESGLGSKRRGGCSGLWMYAVFPREKTNRDIVSPRAPDSICPLGLLASHDWIALLGE
jgi:hypothetical protein